MDDYQSYLLSKAINENTNNLNYEREDEKQFNKGLESRDITTNSKKMNVDQSELSKSPLKDRNLEITEKVIKKNNLKDEIQEDILNDNINYKK